VLIWEQSALLIGSSAWYFSVPSSITTLPDRKSICNVGKLKLATADFGLDVMNVFLVQKQENRNPARYQAENKRNSGENKLHFKTL
jgi:hypothetical protein